MSATYDTIIVGAGAIGLAIGWRASQLGLSVLQLDRSKPGSGASHAAAGMLAPITEAAFGEERLLELNRESARLYPEFLAELSEASDRDLRSTASGTLFVALDRDQAESLRRLFDFQRSLGLTVEWLSGERCRLLEPALHPSARGAILATEDKEIDPREMISALEIALARAGGALRAHAEVSAVAIRNGRAEGVVLASGERLISERVVIAAGCWSGAIAGIPRAIAEAIRPVKGQILRLRPRRGEPPISRHIVRTGDVYLVPRRDGGVVAGATVEEQGFETALTAGGVFELLRAAEETMPGIREFELIESEAGLRPGTPDNRPLLGRCSIDGLIIATGHYRNGILLTPVTADSIAELLAKDETPAEIGAFDPERFSR